MLSEYIPLFDEKIDMEIGGFYEKEDEQSDCQSY